MQVLHIFENFAGEPNEIAVNPKNLWWFDIADVVTLTQMAKPTMVAYSFVASPPDGDEEEIRDCSIYFDAVDGKVDFDETGWPSFEDLERGYFIRRPI